MFQKNWRGKGGIKLYEPGRQKIGKAEIPAVGKTLRLCSKILAVGETLRLRSKKFYCFVVVVVFVCFDRHVAQYASLFLKVSFDIDIVFHSFDVSVSL